MAALLSRPLASCSLTRAARCQGRLASVRTYASSKASPESLIQSTVADNKVAVFSKEYCPYCSETKALLKSLKVEAKILELDVMGSEGDAIQAQLQPMTGSRTVPQVFIGGKYIGGNSDTQALHTQKKLVPLLQAAGVQV